MRPHAVSGEGRNFLDVSSEGSAPLEGVNIGKSPLQADKGGDLRLGVQDQGPETGQLSGTHRQDSWAGDGNRESGRRISEARKKRGG